MSIMTSKRILPPLKPLWSAQNLWLILANVPQEELHSFSLLLLTYDMERSVPFKPAELEICYNTLTHACAQPPHYLCMEKNASLFMQLRWKGKRDAKIITQ